MVAQSTRRLEKERRAVLEAVAAAGDEGMIREEVELACSLAHTPAVRRLSELIDLGLIERYTETRVAPLSGRHSPIYRATDYGRVRGSLGRVTAMLNVEVHNG